MSKLNWLAEQVAMSGLTKGDIAANLGISRPTLDSYIHNPDNLKVSQLEALESIGFKSPRKDAATVDPVSMTVTANYIQDAPDLQMRIWLRAWLTNTWDVDAREKIQILRQEADRFEHGLGASDD